MIDPLKMLAGDVKARIRQKVVNVGNRPNPYTLTTKVGNMAHGMATMVRSVNKKSTDKYQFHFEASQESRVMVRGDGDAPLVVSVLDGKGKEIMKSAGGTGPQVITFTPPEAGLYTVQVQNQGDVWNRYVMTLP